MVRTPSLRFRPLFVRWLLEGGRAPWKVPRPRVLRHRPSPKSSGVYVHRSFSFPPVRIFVRRVPLPFFLSVLRPVISRVSGVWSKAQMCSGPISEPSSRRRASSTF